MDQTASPSLSTFINGLLDEVYGKAGLSEDQRISMHEELLERLTTLINTNLITAIPKEKVMEFNHLIDTEAQENDIRSFIESSVTDPQGVIVKTLLDFRTIYLNGQTQLYG